MTVHGTLNVLNTSCCNRIGLEVSSLGIGAWSWGDRTGYWVSPCRQSLYLQVLPHTGQSLPHVSMVGSIIMKLHGSGVTEVVTRESALHPRAMVGTISGKTTLPHTKQSWMRASPSLIQQR